MEHAVSHTMLRDAVLLLGSGLAFVLLFRRLGLGGTLGYLFAGIVMGPYVLGLVGGAEDKLNLGDLGITLLLFIVGLELAPARLWRLKQEIFGLGLLQVVACGAVLTVLLGLGTDFTWAAAIALGLPLALSSTAQVLPMLQSAGRLRTPFGERAFSILLLQDLSLIPLITIVAALSRNPADKTGATGLELVVAAVVAIVGLIAAGRFLLRPLLRLIGNLGERELFIVAALFAVLTAAAVMEMLGLSPALGAFIAGLMLADTPYRHELEADVEPFRSILLGLFFLSVGMMLDLTAIAERPGFVALMALGLIVVKATVIFAIGLLFKMTWRGALALGLLLSQGGEFGFVLFAQGQQALLISPAAASLFGAVVTVSMIATPFLMMATRRIRTEPSAGGGTREAPSSDGAHALVIGYGRFGQTVSQMLIASDIRVTLIDDDVDMIDRAELNGAKVYFGDGARLDILRQAGAADAQLICFCFEGEKLSTELLCGIREAFPHLKILVRAYDRRTVIRLSGAPIDYIVRELLESAVAMARAALEALGESIEAIDEAEAEYRSRDDDRMNRQIETGDLAAARERILTQSRRREQ